MNASTCLLISRDISLSSLVSKACGAVGCGEIVLAFGAGYNRRGGVTMGENLKAELDAALK
jgi:hypothetical protein